MKQNMKKLFSWPVGLLLPLVLLLALPSAQAQNRIYVANLNLNSVSVIDALAHALLPPGIPVIKSPCSIAVTPDGMRAYVTGATNNQLSVIDLDPSSPTFEQATLLLTGGPLPTGIAIRPDGTRAYVVNQQFVPGVVGQGSVTVLDIDPASATFNQALMTIPVGMTPFFIALSPDGRRAYVSNSNAFGPLPRPPDTVSVIDIDPASPMVNTQIALVPVGVGPIGIAVAPDGTRVYVSNFFSNEVSVIDTASNQVSATLPLAGSPWGMSITPDGRLALATNFGLNTVTALDINPASPTFHTVVDTILVGVAPFATAISPNGTQAAVSNHADDTVSILDLTLVGTGAPPVVATIGLAPGSFPRGLTYSLPVATPPGGGGGGAGGGGGTQSSDFDTLRVSKGHLELEKKHADGFDLEGTVLPVSGIPNEEVIVTLAGFSRTIPAGTLVAKNDDDHHDEHGNEEEGTVFTFKEKSGKTRFEFQVSQQGTFKIEAEKVDLGPIDRKKVPFSLQIGNLRGEALLEFDKKGRFKRQK